MRRLSVISAITVLLVAAASLSDAAKTVKGSKSNSDNRIEGAATPADTTTVKSSKSNSSERIQMPATPGGAVTGKDPCTDYKNDTNRYGACQKAARLGSSQVGGGQGQKVSVCSGGYWWTGGWGGWTQGGPCSPEGAIK